MTNTGWTDDEREAGLVAMNAARLNRETEEFRDWVAENLESFGLKNAGRSAMQVVREYVEGIWKQPPPISSPKLRSASVEALFAGAVVYATVTHCAPLDPNMLPDAALAMANRPGRPIEERFRKALEGLKEALAL